MRITAILLVLAAILGRQPMPTKPPTEEIWKLTLPEAIRVELEKPAMTGTDEIGDYFLIGATKIYYLGFEPVAPGPDGEQDRAGSLGPLYDESLRAGVPGPGRP